VHAVGEAELGEQVTDVGLDGGLGQVERLADLGNGSSGGA
jgi:hypothetical protein